MTRPSFSFEGVLLGKVQRVLRRESWRPRKMARVDEGIGLFVADICTVAERKDLSHCEIRVIADQLSSVSSNARKSLLTATKRSITLRY